MKFIMQEVLALIIVIILTLIIAVVGLFLVLGGGTMGISRERETLPTHKLQNHMKITSSSFEHNKRIPEKYTCDGEDINPPLAFSDISNGARSLVLIVDDPDAPVGLYVHWVVWNIPPDTKETKEHSTPKGASEGMTSFGKVGYGGPCPPSGEHRYFFKVYALDIELDLPPESDKEAVEEAMVGHVLDKAELMGLYSR